MTDEPIELAEVQGISLATFTVIINLMRMLQERGAISAEDTKALLSTSLRVLEKDERISEQSVHNARELLATIAEQFDVSLTKPS